MRERAIRNIEEVLETSFDYLTEHGLENTSIRDLSTGTGMSLGSIYYWFSSKEDIVVSAAEYGLAKAAGALFEYAFDTMHELDIFTENFLDVVKKHQSALRIVYQVTTSPVYGARIRKKAEGINVEYEKYIEKLSKIVKIPYDELRPIVFLFIATILDFVVWDDYDFSKSQLNYLYNVLREKTNENPL